MNNPLRGKCETCKNFDQEVEGIPSTHGLCRAHPPYAQVIIVTQAHPISGERMQAPQTFTTFPIVELANWCNEWSRPLALLNS